MPSYSSLTEFAACAAGALAVAAGVYYIHKRGNWERRTEALEVTSIDKDPVLTVSSGFLQSSNGQKDMQMYRATPEKGKVDSVQPQELYVLTLENRVMALEKQLCEVHRESEMKSKECEQERQAHSIVKEKYDEMQEVVKKKEELLRAHESKLIDLEDRGHCLEELLHDVIKESETKSEELERERQYYNVLWSRYEDTNDTLAEAEERGMVAVESNAQLEYEKSILMEQAKALQDSVEKLEGQLYEARRARVKLMKHENSNLRVQVKTLQDSVEKLEEQLSEAGRMCEEKMHECEQERQAHSMLKKKYDEMQEVVKQKEELLKADESKLIDLEDRGTSLEERLLDVVKESETQSEECEQEQQAHSMLREKCDEMLELIKQKMELLHYT